VITEYHGRTRRATVEFETNVSYGSHYAIRHDVGLGMGYKIGRAGYMPVGYLPQPGYDCFLFLFSLTSVCIAPTINGRRQCSCRGVDVLTLTKWNTARR